MLSPTQTEDQTYLTNMNNGHAHHIMMKKVVCFINGPGDKKVVINDNLKKPSATHNMRTNATG